MTLRKSMILDWSPLHESLLKMDLQFHNLIITDLSAHINIDHFIPDENPWVKVETCDSHPFLSRTNRGLLMNWILLTQTSGCNRKPQYAPNIGIYNLLHSQCMPKNEHYGSICTTARENVLLFHMAKGTAKARPSLPCGSELVKSERKESHSSFLIPLYAQHNIKLLQSLQTITDQKTNCLLVFLIPILFHFRPDSLFQISCTPKQWNHSYHLKWHSHFQTANSCTCDTKFIRTYIHTGNSVHQSKTRWPV